MGSSRPHKLFKSPSCNLHTSLYPAHSQSASGSRALHANRFPKANRSVSVFGCSHSSLRITIHYAFFFFFFFLNNNPWVCFSHAVSVILSKLWNQLLFKLTDSQFRLKYSHSWSLCKCAPKKMWTAVTARVFPWDILPWYNRTGWLGVKYHVTATTQDKNAQRLWVWKKMIHPKSVKSNYCKILFILKDKDGEGLCRFNPSLWTYSQ